MTSTSAAAPISSGDTSTRAELPERCSIPWRTGLRLGSGIDSLTATAAPSPFVALETELVHEPEETILVGFSRGLGTTLIAAPTVRDNPLPSLGHLGLRAWSMAKALALTEPLKPNFSLLIWWDRVGDIVRPSSTTLPSMTADALDLYRESPTRFRERFGDYYIAGAKRGSRFAAILTISCNDDVLKSSVDQLLQTTKPLPAVQSDINTFFDSSAIQSIDVRVFTYSDADEPNAVENFACDKRSESAPFSACIARLRTLAAASDDHILAELAHYSTHSVLSSLTRVVPLDDEAREKQWRMCDALEGTLIRVASIPGRVALQGEVLALRDRVSSLAEKCVTIRHLLVQYNLVGTVIRLLTSTVRDLDKFFGVYELWTGLALATFQKSNMSEPWRHGLTASNEFIHVEDHAWESSTEARPFSTRLRRRFLFNSELVRESAPPGAHIVGWTVKAADPGAGDGDWDAYAGGRLLQPTVRFLMVPGRMRTRWQFTIHYARNEYLDDLIECYRDELGELSSSPFARY